MTPDADSVLYDAACDTLLAAQALRRTAERTGRPPAVAPSLACLSRVCEELRGAVGALGERPLPDPELRRLALALAVAGRAAESAREAAAADVHAASAQDGERSPWPRVARRDRLWPC
jgi:hypothetical protein